MNKIYKKLSLILLFASLFIIPLSAKDTLGLGLQFGALGSEKTSTNSSTIAGDTISMPYTKTTFDPTLHILLSIPVCDINENFFFGLDLGYTFSWNYSYGSLTSYQRESYTFSHRFSLMPEFIFAKSNFRVFAGTGFAFGIEPYKYRDMLNRQSYSNEYTNFKLFWTFNAGLKYKLGKHISAVFDVTFFANLFDTYTNNDFKSETSGNSAMEFLPKIGLMYQF